MGDHRLDRYLVPGDTPQADHFLPADLPHAAVDEDSPDLPRRGPPTPLTGRGEPLAPLGHGTALALGTLLRRQGVQPGIVPQAGEELDAARTVLGQDQRPDHASQGEAAIEDGQVPSLGNPGLFPEQVHGQLALGAERFGAAGFPGRWGNCDLRK